MTLIAPRLPLVAAIVWTLAGGALAQEGNLRAEKLAQQATLGKKALAYVQEKVRRLHDPKVRAAVQAILENPAPTFMTRFVDDAGREAARAALIQAELLDPKVTLRELFPPLGPLGKETQSFLAAPGGTTDGHHAYPGGLAEHIAFNLQASLALAGVYQERYGLDLDDDLLIAAATLHDAMKPWALQWKADGTLTAQPAVGYTATHHIYILAEALFRKLPAELVLTIAAAHEAPGIEPAIVVAYLRAAAIMAGVPFSAAGLVPTAADPKKFELAHPPPIEAGVNHLGDHDYVVTEPTGRLVAAAVDRLVAADPDARDRSAADLRWRRLEILGRVPFLVLYQALRGGGDGAVKAELRRRAVSLAPAPLGAVE